MIKVMASASDTMPMADDEWIVDTARRCLKSNPYEAKAWLITARTLFPRNFAIQVNDESFVGLILIMKVNR